MYLLPMRLLPPPIWRRRIFPKTLLSGKTGLRLVALALVAALAAPAYGQGPAEPPIPVALEAHWTEADKTASLSFNLSENIQAQAYAMKDPERIIIDLPETNFQIDPSVGRTPPEIGKSRIIKAFRFGKLAPSRSRIVIDLAGTACVAGVSVAPIAPGNAAALLRIDLEACTPAIFAAAVKDAGAAKFPSSIANAPEPPAAAALPVIVLDPGHGGVDGGANGPGGVVEKTLVLEFAQELSRQLSASGKFKVVMTRTGDDFVSLDDRVDIARGANAALLVSLHADTLTEGAGVSGATVYTLADRASDAEAARIAAHENAADQAAGLENKADQTDVADILSDLKQRENRTYSHLFSRDVVKNLTGIAKLNRNPERSARFVVLKAPDFPSVLIELGYLSSQQDVKSLQSAEWRAKTANALSASLLRFFDLGAAQTRPAPALAKGTGP